MDVPSGVLYLKIPIGRTCMDSMASPIPLHAKITNLHVTISTYHYDINNFNNHVRQIGNYLAARGEIVPDLLDRLIREYITTPDSAIADYNIRRQDAYEEGIKITAEQLTEGGEVFCGNCDQALEPENPGGIKNHNARSGRKIPKREELKIPKMGKP